jgi:hypothetical protein
MSSQTVAIKDADQGVLLDDQDAADARREPAQAEGKDGTSRARQSGRCSERRPATCRLRQVSQRAMGRMT